MAINGDSNVTVSELEAVYFGLRFSFDGKVEGRGEAWSVTLRCVSSRGFEVYFSNGLLSIQK